MNKLKGKQAYRRDIDGLRAVAIISVVLYHLSSDTLPGGFVGVDIFFVISGYLITLGIIKDLDQGEFSIVDFYSRRVKRIMPAMLLVLFVILVVSFMIQLPGDRKMVGEASIASLFSLANVYFWLSLDQGYFAPQSDTLPLLHFWSLGVEEQFYILWPLLLTLIYTAMRGRHFLGLFSSIAVVSFVLGQVLFTAFPSFVYYMLPTRAGELMVGAIAAHVVNRVGAYRLPGVFVSAAALAGVLCVAASLLLLTEDSVFPGIRAIPPTAGAALLILAGHYGNPSATRLLRAPPLVFIGLISYSAYLWHWPLMAFFRYSGLEIGYWSGTAIIALTIGLAWLTYRFVEQPTRRYRGSALRVFSIMYLLPVVALLWLSLAAVNFHGYSLLSGSATRQEVLRNSTRPAIAYEYVCQRDELTNEELEGQRCIVGLEQTGKSREPAVLLWGDSNAAHYVGVLGAFAKEAGFQFRNLEHSACPPISWDPEAIVSAKWLDGCRKSLERVWSKIDHYDVLIIAASWPSYDARSPEFLSAFLDSVAQLARRGKHVILLGKVPVIVGYDRNCAEKAVVMSFLECDRQNMLGVGIERINKELSAFAEKTMGVEYYDVVAYLCPGGLCSAYATDGEPLYYDTGHLSLPGSWALGEEIARREGGAPFPFSAIPTWVSADGREIPE